VIDFRYHLVSLVSVFIALAVGIVLGAGPLKESLGNTLKGEVEDLRQDRESLKVELDRLETSQRHRDDFIVDIRPSLVGQRLGGRSVVVVALPGIDGESVKSLTEALKDAGATVTGRVDVAEAWSSPAKSAFREQLAAQLQAGLGTAAGTGDTSEQLAALLARAVVTGDLAASGKLDATAKTLLEGLTSADLVSVDDDLDSRATEAVVLAPPVTAATATTSVTTSDAAEATVISWRTLAATLDEASDGAVVLGPASSAADGGLVAAVRAKSDLGSKLSTVDTGGTPMGPVSTVLALSEQLRGLAGDYGFGEGADDVLPELADAGSGQS